MYELFGPESCGKSTLTIHQLLEYQLAVPDKKVALIDFEHAFDKNYAKSIGLDINPNRFLIYQPDSLEDGYNMVLGLVESEIISCAVLDSQTAATPKAIINGEIGDATIGLQARLNSIFCLKIKSLLSKHNCSLFVISQLRSDIGGMSQGDKPSGGNAWKFYADARWKVWKMNDKINELNKTTVDVIKNKLASPFGQAKFNINWGTGISKEDEVLDYACDFDIIKKAGSWFSYGDTKLGQGSDKVITLFKDNPEFYEEIYDKVIARLKNEKEVLTEEIEENGL
jgi:recombination protein RecA